MADSSNSYDVSQAMNDMADSIGTFTTTIENRNAQKRAYKYWEKSVDKQNEINQANYEKQRQDNIDFALNSKLYETQALRNAGLNPAWAQDGAGNFSASSSAPSIADAPSGQYDSNIGQAGMQSWTKLIQSQQMALQSRMQEAQIENLDSQSKKNLAEADATGVRTTFLPDLLGSEINANNAGANNSNASARKSNADAELQERVNGYFAEHPDSFSAIQDYQKELTINLGKQREVMEAQRKNINMDTSKKDREKELLLYDMDYKAALTSFTSAERSVLLDRNFQEHYNDPAWLLREMDDEIDAMEFDNVEEASQRLAILRMCYENCSAERSDKRKFAQQLGIQENDLEYKYVALGTDAFGNLVRNIRKAKRKAGKKGRNEPRSERDIYNERDVNDHWRDKYWHD